MRSTTDRRTVAGPADERVCRARPIRVVQFGQGVFLRAFTDWMINRLNHETGTDIGVAVVQPRDGDEVENLMAQGGRYTLLLQGSVSGENVTQSSVVDCVEQGLNTHRQPEAFKALARNPEVRVIFSNTTEAGIIYDTSDAALDEDQRHLARSFPAKLTWFLAERYAALGNTEGSSLYVIPCELIENNGEQLHAAILRLASDWGLGPSFHEWLGQNVSFYDTLVDRLVPGFPSSDIERLEAEWGYSDPFAVKGEWYHAFLLKGSTELLEVLPFQTLDLNVSFVDDLRPHRDLKVRILNGTHTALTPVAYLTGAETVLESMNTPILRRFVEELIFKETLPSINQPAEVLEGFAADVLERFDNPFIEHRLLSISLNSISKFRTRLIPILEDLWSQGIPAPRHLAFSLAAFIAFHEGQHGSDQIPLRDDRDALHVFAELWALKRAGEISIRDLVEAALGSDALLGGPEWPAPFVTAVVDNLDAIETKGMRVAVAEHVGRAED